MFLLQQGWGMLSFISEYLNNHANSGVILSPRICEREQLERYLPTYTEINSASIYFDPHFYEPRTSLERILSYPYFNNYNFQTQAFDSVTFCRQVIEYQINSLQLSNIILPGRYTNSPSDTWLAMQYEFAEIGSNYRENRQVYSTLSIGPDLILSPEHFNNIIDEVINYPVDGIYFVFEHPANNFLLDEDILYVLLEALLSLSLSGKKIILGYANHQSLLFYAAGIDLLASGNYRNVRCFDHLNSTDRDTDNLRKGIWYFDGNTFGEYKIPAIALAFRRNLRNHFGPITAFNQNLLNSVNPGAVRWAEGDAFKNYLDQMYSLCCSVGQLPKNSRANFIYESFIRIAACNDSLANAGFNFGDRGFNNHINGTIAALEAFIRDRQGDISSLL